MLRCIIISFRSRHRQPDLANALPEISTASVGCPAFFDLHSDLTSFRYVEGMELASSEMAGKKLMRALPGTLHDELLTVTERCSIRADLRDDAGQIIFMAQLSLTTKWLE